MNRRIVQCEGASIPAQWKFEFGKEPLLQVNRFGISRQVNFRLHEFSDPLAGTLQGKAFDLVNIAAYIYVADQLVRRGGGADLYGTDWRREMAVSLPVSDPDFWNSPQIRSLLEQVVGFVSEDTWHFAFSTSHAPEQLPLTNIDQQSIRCHPDSVVLFSGGADSLCATVEAVLDHGLKPVLVSHRPVQLISSQQKDLVDHLRDAIPGWRFPHSKFEINKIKTDEKDTTQRTRSFLYASLGAAVASSLEIGHVMLADNGVVSLNLPINAQLLGSTASRSTHPRFIHYFNELAKLVLPSAPQISNPLSTRTKAECLSILKKHNIPELFQYTNSCAHRRNLSSDKPHCGVCSQCVDRRFAFMAAKLEQYDPIGSYKTDIFRDALEGNAVTMVESFLRFARKIKPLTPEEIFLDYFQIEDVIFPEDKSADDTAQKYTSLIGRHAASVINVVTEQARATAQDLVLAQLPATCLISLSVQTPNCSKEIKEPVFQYSEDYSWIRWHKQEFNLSGEQAAAVSILHQAYRAGSPTLSKIQILKRLENVNYYPQRIKDIFKGSPLWEKLIVSPKRGYYGLRI